MERKEAKENISEEKANNYSEEDYKERHGGNSQKKPVHKRPIGRVFDPKRGRKSRNNVPLK